MKYFHSLICVVLVIANFAHGQDNPPSAPITLEELNRRNVIGRLGIPLGTAVEIEGEVVSGRTLRAKAYVSLYLIKVTHVDGGEIKEPPLMRFAVRNRAEVKLASDTSGLYELKHAKQAKGLGSKQLAELEKGYVGKKVRLLVYEEGQFRGLPGNLPEDAGGWADVGFGFTTSLTVLIDRDFQSKSSESNP